MLRTWSNLCAVQLGKRISHNIKQSYDRLSPHSALNVYYLIPPPPNNSSYNGQVLQRLQACVNRDSHLLYPLTRPNFEAELWQTSAKLLVVLEANTNDNEGAFDVELKLVSQFIGDGGNVLLLLNQSHDSSGFSPFSLGRLVSATSSEPPCPPCASTWKWALRDTDNGMISKILIGFAHPNNASLVVLPFDPTQTLSEGLNESLRLLAIATPSKSIDPPIPIPDSLREPTVFFAFQPNSSPNTSFDLFASRHTLSRCSDLNLLPTGFDWTDYVHTLKTRHLGRSAIWVESIESSWDLCESFFGNLPANSGLLLVSNCQTRAKGRGENQWLTPRGQAAFSFHLTLTKPSSSSGDWVGTVPFMNYVTCVQHLVALSIALAAKQLIAEQLGCLPPSDDGNEEFLVNLSHPGPQIRLKWPNDVYVVQSDRVTLASCGTESVDTSGQVTSKLAGLLTRCSMVDTSRVDCLLGVGINVSNPSPTQCLQNVLNAISPSPQPVSVAKVIAVVLNHLERLLDQTLYGGRPSALDWALGLYTKCWIHSGQWVQIASPASSSASTPEHRCQIIGLDSFGYLRVWDPEARLKYSLHPNGNSMDMMRGLIRPKQIAQRT